MERRFDRRMFSKTIGFGLGAAMLGAAEAQGAPKRRLKIGHTGINWGYRPEDAEQAIKDTASLGYHGYESFGSILEAWESKGGLGRVLEASKLPLVSAFCGANVLDPAKRKDEVAKLVRWGQLIKKYGGSIVALNADGAPRKREGYVYKDHKANIVAGLNEVCKALAEIGVVGALHQHTGSCIETSDEVYSVLESVDTRYVKFGPDIGQLAKGGSDPVKIVKDFLALIEHVHLKDWNGGPYWAEYCPLGMGKVDIPAILDLLEKSKIKAMLMVELDYSKGAPMTPFETARTSKAYLEKQGYEFRS
jgi:inosose dehydratase